MKLPRWIAPTAPPLARSAIAVAGGWAGLGLLVSAVALAHQAGAGSFQGELVSGLLDALALATLSFGFRFLRWHRLATRLAPGLPLAASLHIQAIGFALSATPGKVGELLKVHLLAEQTGVPAGRGGSIFLVEKLTEALTFAGLAAVGGLLVSTTGGAGLAGLASVGGLGVVAAGLVAVRKLGPLRSGPNPLAPLGPNPRAQRAPAPSLATSPAPVCGRAPALSTRWRGGRGRGSVRFPLPFREGGEGVRPGGLRLKLSALLAELGDGSQQLVRPGPLAEAFFLCAAARTCDALAIVVVAGSLGAPIVPGFGLLALGASGTVGGLSMLPGGVGAAEATMSGVLLAAGLDASTALTASLIVRGIVYWLWVSIGLALAVRLIRSRRRVA